MTLVLAAVVVAVAANASRVIAAPTAAVASPSMPSLASAAVDDGGIVSYDADLPPITAAFRGHLFGSPTAHDEAVAMGLDPAGNLYLAGTTTPHGGGGTPWGTLLPGYTGGGADFWVAKISPATALVWVRRAGSAFGERAAAMAVGRTGVVVCGSTGGDMRANGGRVVGAVSGEESEHVWASGGGRITGAVESGGRITGADGGGGRITGAVESGADGGTMDGRSTSAMGTVVGGGGSLSTLSELLITATGGGSATPAAPDAMLVKLAPDGTEAWASALQIGGTGADDCRALAMDADAGWVWAAGSTSSMLFSRTSGAAAMGNARPPTGRSDYWVAKAAAPGLLPELVAGVQRGAERANSADAIALSGDRLYVVANTYDEMLGEGGGGVAMLHVYAAATLELISSTAVPAPDGVGGVAAGASVSSPQGLHLTALTVDRAHAAYMGGFVGDATAGRGSYAVAKYHASRGWVWARPYGRYSHVEPAVAMAVNPAGTVVYVGGVTDGFYADAATTAGASRGHVLAPLLELNATTGALSRRWQRTTAIPGDAERTTAVAVDSNGAVVYAGSRLASGSSMAGMRKALLGAVGSASYATRLAGGWTNSATGGDGEQAVHVDTSTGAADKRPATMPLTAVVGLVAGVMGGAVVIVGAMVMGVKRRQVAVGTSVAAAAEGAEGAPSSEAGGGEAARAQALAVMEAVLPYPGAALAGGSAVPV
ncbi:hypothetical protein MMPV_006520 [Pyropia vietnamensis]